MSTEKKGATLTRTGNIHAGYGHVKAIRMGSEYGPEGADDGMAEITVHHGPKPKPSRNKGFSKPEPYKETKTSRLHIPHEEAKELRIGDRVRVSLHRHK